MSIEEKLIAYLDQALSATERQHLEVELEQSEALRQQLEELRDIWDGLEELPAHEPSENLEQRFYAHLKQAEQAEVKPRRINPWWQVAAAIAILLLGIMVGQRTSSVKPEIAQLQDEVKKTQNLMMLAMLKQESASVRIKAVGMSEEMKDANHDIIEALINTMQFDGNINVRIHAADALSRYGNKASVRNAFLQSLSEQNDPEMQMKIIDVLVRLQEQRAVGEMLKLLERDSLFEGVKFKAEKGVEELML